MFGQETMEFPGKGDDMVFGVVDTRVMMIAHGHGPQDLYAGFLGRDRETIEEGLVGLFRGPQKELALGTATAEEPDAALGNVTGHGHGGEFDQLGLVLQEKVTPVGNSLTRHRGGFVIEGRR